MNHLPDNPWTVFEEWRALAKPLGEQIADAMALATVDAKGQPSARIVLCRGVLRDALAFYTNYQSRKGSDLALIPRRPRCFIGSLWASRCGWKGS